MRILPQNTQKRPDGRHRNAQKRRGIQCPSVFVEGDFSVFGGKEPQRGVWRIYHRTRRNGLTADTERHRNRNRFLLNDIAADVGFRVGIEIDEKPELESCCLEIVEKLRRMALIQRFCCLQFDNDLIEADDVRYIKPTVTILIENVELLFSGKGDAAYGKFFFKRILIDLLKIAGAKCLIDLKDGTTKCKCFVLIDIIVHGSSISNLLFRVLLCSPKAVSVCSVVKTLRAIK